MSASSGSSGQRPARRRPSEPADEAPAGLFGRPRGTPRQQLFQQWQRANIVFTIGAFTLGALIPYVALVLINRRWDLGIPNRVGQVWLMALVAGWFASLFMGAYVAATAPGLDQRSRRAWIAALVFPVTTLPAAVAFGYLRRRALYDDVKAEDLLPKRRWRFR